MMSPSWPKNKQDGEGSSFKMPLDLVIKHMSLAEKTSRSRRRMLAFPLSFLQCG